MDQQQHFVATMNNTFVMEAQMQEGWSGFIIPKAHWDCFSRISIRFYKHQGRNTVRVVTSWESAMASEEDMHYYYECLFDSVDHVIGWDLYRAGHDPKIMYRDELGLYQGYWKWGFTRMDGYEADPSDAAE